MEIANLKFTLLSVPSEILEQIFTCSSLTCNDICNLAQTCSVFREIARGNRVWKSKFTQRWPDLLENMTADAQTNWCQTYQDCYNCASSVRKKIASMSAKYYHKEHVPANAFSDLQDMSETGDNYAMYVTSALQEILHGLPELGNLTNKFYAEKAFPHIKCKMLKKKFEELYSKPAEEQLIEEGAVYIAEWCQPYAKISMSSIVHRLDTIAGQARSRLLHQHPDHPITNHKELSTVLTQNLWDPKECRQVLEAINFTLYDLNNFNGNTDDYQHPHNSFIDKVLLSGAGIPITLCIVYLAVARRLGVRCHMINFPAHILLSWVDKPQYSPMNKQYSFIDAFDRGKILPNKSDCEELVRNIANDPDVFVTECYQPVTDLRLVYARMTRNLIHIFRSLDIVFLPHVMELAVTVDNEDYDTFISLARTYTFVTRTNMEQVPALLEPVMRSERVDLHGLAYYIWHTARELSRTGGDSTENLIPKRRSTCQRHTIKYRTGMVMRHVKYHYRCVICGWDEECKMGYEWQVQMGVDKLPHQDKQPFYSVMVEDGSGRYAAQENLTVEDDGQPVSHPQIGRYFEEFCETHGLFKPNAELKHYYPEDGDCDSFVNGAGDMSAETNSDAAADTCDMGVM